MEDRTGQDRTRGQKRGEERSRMSRQWLPLVTRAAVALEISTAMINQPRQGKNMPDNIYFMVFESRGNNNEKQGNKKSEIV